MLKPLTLGNKTFPNNLIQGPLAGVSCAPFRALTWRYSQPAYSCTEMISCKTLIHQSNQAKHRYVSKDSEEGPVCFQLAGNDPQEVAEATKRVTDYGADIIDLNCGCPVNKIRSKGAGSRLLTDAPALYKLIVAMKQHTTVPVTIKIRVEGADEIFHQDIANVVRDAGADALVVHGRHWTQHYETPCRYDAIQFFVDALSIPVIGNGDIACSESLKKMLATGCAGVMIGRAGVGQPWLIRQLITEWNGDTYALPELSERGAMFLQHVKQLSQLLESEKFAVLQARKFAGYYARGCDHRPDIVKAVNQCDTLSGLEALIIRFFNLER